MNARVTDAQARTFAAYDEQTSSTVWYNADPRLLEEVQSSDSRADEFAWLRDLAADLLDERARCAGLILAIETIRALPIAHGVMRQIIEDAIHVAKDGISAPRTAHPEYACDCGGEGRCGYCHEQAVCREEYRGDREERGL
jgi:hypothetical protein